jgi:hypothetical protein
MQTSKIARFPRHIREEVNQRLDRAEKQASILKWLNALPEVQTVLQAEFNGEPVKRQNLQSWKSGGFRNWQLHQSALAFTNDTLPDDLDPSALEQMSAKLIRFLQIRYAALAGSLPAPHEDPEAELARLAGLCTNLTALRRGDLSAQRLTLEHERLTLERSRAVQEQEKLFWSWTQRPDIQEKLYPNRDPDTVRRDVDRLITERMLGIRRNVAPENGTIDPACLI